MKAEREPDQPSPLWHTLLPVIVLSLIGFAFAYQFVDPAPPDHLVIAAGSRGGAYYKVAEGYRDVLAESGIRVEVLTTGGSLSNLELLNAGKAGLGFVQGGIHDPNPGSSLRAIGSIYFEPLWVFTRKIRPVVMSDLLGKRLAIGGKGSGTRALADELLALNQMDASNTTLIETGGDEALNALYADEVDAVFMVAGAQSQRIQSLATDPAIHLMSFARAEAYARHKRYLSPLTLPRGALDLATDRPPVAKKLIAVAANLVASPELHPALLDLLLQAARRVHANGGLFEQPDEFPSERYLTLPLHEEAARFYRHGPPLLQRYLPFWAASLVDRLWVMVLPLIAIMIPLMKIMPPLFTWRMRSRVYRWYRDLGRVDRAIQQGRFEQAVADLERIEGEIRQISVPLSITDELYDLRVHIDLLRRHLKAARDG